MSLRPPLALVLCLAVSDSRAQSVSFQWSALDASIGALHAEASLQPTPWLTMDLHGGYRSPANRGVFLEERRTSGSIVDVALMYSADTDPGPRERLFQIGGYWQRKWFERFETYSGLIFSSRTEQETAVDLGLVGMRIGYKHVTPAGFTSSFHVGVAGVARGGTRLVSTTSTSRASAEERVADDHEYPQAPRRRPPTLRTLAP